MYSDNVFSKWDQGSVNISKYSKFFQTKTEVILSERKCMELNWCCVNFVEEYTFSFHLLTSYLIGSNEFIFYIHTYLCIFPNGGVRLWCIKKDKLWHHALQILCAWIDWKRVKTNPFVFFFLLNRPMCFACITKHFHLSYFAVPVRFLS